MLTSLYSWTSLSQVLNRRFEVVEYLLRRPDVHVGNPTAQLWTPLMMASREGDFDILQLLLEGPKGSDVDVNAVNHLGQTALHIAVQFCPVKTRLPVAQALMAHGANPNIRDEFGRSAVRTASSTSQHALANFLLAKSPVPVPALSRAEQPSRLVAGLTTTAPPVEIYGHTGPSLVPNMWVTAGQGIRSLDKRPPICAKRSYT